MNVRCDSRFGALDVSHIEGSLDGKSGNGRIGITNASFGLCDARSSFGAIAAGGLRGDSVTLNSGNGGIRIACSPAGPADLKAQVRSSFGGVDFTAPTRFAGEVNLNANFGTVKTAMPITISREISRNRVAGTIGDGAGRIRLESGNGSVELR